MDGIETKRRKRRKRIGLGAKVDKGEKKGEGGRRRRRGEGGEEEGEKKKETMARRQRGRNFKRKIYWNVRGKENGRERERRIKRAEEKGTIEKGGIEWNTKRKIYIFFLPCSNNKTLIT